ncbi:MAG: tetratricopeptide repeat protein [Pirellulales bacterium]|nr:tetratricopeptide repeat protein [Pirellulales bacterium]
MEFIAREADAITRRAFELGGRNAYFSSRAEFVAALRLVAQGLDRDGRTQAYSQALANALTALSEADDFVPGAAQLEANLNLKSIVACHGTPVLKTADLSNLTAMAASQFYLTFAQEQFGAASGGEVAASMALRGLGKLHETMADKKVQGIVAARPKAVTFFQSALLACPANHMASNDLGVMLARNGRLEDARTALEHSLLVSQQASTWHNLAVVYGQLGDPRSAERARRQAQSLTQATPGGRQGKSSETPVVQWVDPQTFAQRTTETPGAPAFAPPVRPATNSTGATATTPDRQISRWQPGKPTDKRK